MTRITILVEDTPAPPLRHEHGLSMLVETGEARILFDTGHTDAFMRNAAALEVPLDHLDAVIISHPHYDHAGGLHHLRAQAPLYLSDGFFAPRYSKRDGRYIGPALTKQRLIGAGFDLRYVVETETIAGGAKIITGFHQPHPLEREPSAFSLDPDGEHEDTFSEELMLALPMQDGYLALGGCCHPGVIGMLERCCQTLDSQVTGFIGGMHLLSASEERIRATAVALGGCHLDRLWVGHCTGDHAADMLNELTDLEVKRLKPGLVVEVEQ